MQTFPLKFIKGHLFVTIAEDDWLIDTGAPSSFGDVELIIGNRLFPCPKKYLTLDTTSLSGFVDHETVGIIGMDVIKNFDIIFDIPNGQIAFSTEYLNLEGKIIETDQFMNIPIISVEIAGKTYRMFFDTGAQISYFQDDSLETFHKAGTISDFYPGFGQFETNIYTIKTYLGEESYSLKYGSLPGLLGMSLMMANTQGIIGNEIMANRSVTFSNLRRTITLT